MNLKTTPSAERCWTSDSASGLAASSSGEDHSPANSLSVKVRSACNRCHGQKLRCVKKAGQAKCERCRKLHTLCKFSPRAPRLSLKHVQPAIDGMHEPFPLSPSTHVPNVQDNPIFENGDNCEWLFPPHTSTHLASQPDLNMLPNLCNPMQSDSCQMQDQSWSSTLLNSVMSTPDPFRSFDMDLVHLDSGTMSRENLLHPVSTPLPTRLEQPSKESIYSSSSAVRDLANLSIALHDCATKLPSMPEVGVFPPHISLREKQSARKMALFAIDELFGLTSEFIATMKRLSFADPETDSAIDLDKADNPRTESATPLLTFSQPLARSQRSARLSTNDQPLPFSQLDESTTLLIMSCHSRLIETYVSLFRMMHACLEFNVVPQLEEGAVIILPRLQVGSFAAPSIEVRTGTMPSPGTTSMYMLIITILSTKLFEQLAEAMQMGQEKDRMGEERGNGTAASDSRCGMWNTMNVGTDRLSREIEVTRRLLQQFPVTTP